MAEQELNRDERTKAANRQPELSEPAAQDVASDYRAIFDAANDAIFVHDPESGAILDVNRKMTEMYGYSVAEARCLSLEALSAGTPPYAGQDARRWLKKAVEGEPQLFEWLAKDKAGRLFWVEVNIKCATIGGRDVLLGIVRDIGDRKCAEEALRRAYEELEARVKQRTAELGAANAALQAEIIERKRAQAEQERLAVDFRLLLESTDEGIYGWDINERCTFINGAAARMLGYQPEEVLGKNTHSLFHHSYPDGSPYPLEHCPLYRALHGGYSTRVADEALWRKDGTSFPVEFSAHPIFDRGALRGGVVTFIDITDRKRVEQWREEYVSLISHDLRAPLTVLTGQADWLRRLLAQKGLAREAQSAEAMLKSARRMNAMIQDLVESARLEAGQLELRKEHVDLLQLANDIAERVGTHEDRVRIRVEAPEWVPPVLADPARIERAIVNLLTNALKYSPPDRPVVVRIQQRASEAVLSVRDEGAGIAPEDLAHLFQRYYRAKAGKKAEGLGLGLYITRLIVETHGGHVWAESEPGKGSTFYLSVPLA